MLSIEYSMVPTDQTLIKVKVVLLLSKKYINSRGLCGDKESHRKMLLNEETETKAFKEAAEV